MTTKVYTPEEMEAVERHIEKYFGVYEQVFHELVSEDIHLDICIVEPTAERDYYTLVTMGMGAHRMNVPAELAEQKLGRAELAISLPSDWNISEKDEAHYWPIRLLKQLARLPIEKNTWLGWGHSIENRHPYADDTALSAALLVGAQCAEGGQVCPLPGDEEVNFYQIIPLYPEELKYKLAHNAEALLDVCAKRGVSFVVRPQRRNALSGEDFGDLVMDEAAWHLENLREKELPVDERTAYNHLAIYLRYCIEHDLMADWFRRQYAATVRAVREQPAETDLRPFIRDELHGILMRGFFNEEGEAFAQYYYGDGDTPRFPADIDDYALRYFGAERYHSDEFKDEAYLFIPFDEQYYMDMATVIAQRWDAWKRNVSEKNDHAEMNKKAKPDARTVALMRYLGCPCEYFPPMMDDDPIVAAYSYAARLGVREGYVPVLIAPSDTLWEMLTMNTEAERGDFKDYDFDAAAVATYRREVLAQPLPDGKAILTERLGEHFEPDRAEDDEDDGAAFRSPDQFISYWDYETQETQPLVLAKIPVRHPWEVFAYLPFGGWNDCPDTAALMAVSKYWYEQHAAVPAVLTYDTLEYRMPAPVPQARALALAKEQYAFCADIIEQGMPTVAKLANNLRKSNVWYFWWD